MYFIRKKDLRIVGRLSPQVIQFQMEDYYGKNRIIIAIKQAVHK